MRWLLLPRASCSCDTDRRRTPRFENCGTKCRTNHSLCNLPHTGLQNSCTNHILLNWAETWHNSQNMHLITVFHEKRWFLRALGIYRAAFRTSHGFRCFGVSTRQTTPKRDCALGTKQRLELLTVSMPFKTDRWVSLTSLSIWTRLLSGMEVH